MIKILWLQHLQHFAHSYERGGLAAESTTHKKSNFYLESHSRIVGTRQQGREGKGVVFANDF